VTARVELVHTNGIFSLDGQDFEVENNVWLVGDDHEVLIVDAAHEADVILAAVGDRAIKGVFCTHGHNDHINAAGELAARGGARVWLNPADRMLWDVIHPDLEPQAIASGQEFAVAGLSLATRATPGHSPGGTCLYSPELGVVFSGDTLFNGGPGATGRSFSDFGLILVSIKEQLLSLPSQTRVLTGHGAETTIGAEAGDYQAWVDRGH
jgi:glyoxylase-like metal-dependent hydrolase (beta-lactamase superfamily II)